MQAHYHLIVYVPESHLEKVKEALFAIGAGRTAHYDSCCWQSEGLGQFRPLEGSTPFVGEAGALHQDAEWKLEMLCDASVIHKVEAAIREVHPYEEPAFSLIPTMTL